MPRHFWTAEERAFLREVYGRTTAAVIAWAVDHSVSSVEQQAKILGLTRPRMAPEVRERIRQLHGRGLTDAAIARELGMDRRAVTTVRAKRLGLPASAAGILEARRQGVRTQRKTLGIRSAGQLRGLSFRRYAVEQGWPEDLRPRAVQILNVLAARGVPMTRPELAEAIGMPWKGSRKSLTSNDPEGSYLAHLAARGLVQVLPRAVTVSGQGRGRSLNLYYLGPVALTILEERACKATAETTV